MGVLNFRVPLDSLNRISSPYGYRERVFKDKGKMRDPFNKRGHNIIKGDYNKKGHNKRGQIYF